jgi:dipeptidyl aminopeptidase/acylaminoacyl peptidase
VSSKEISQPVSTLNIVASAWFTIDSLVVSAWLKINKIGSKNDLFVINLQNASLDNRTESDLLGTSGGLQPDMPTLEGRMPKIVVQDNFAYTNVQKGGNINIIKISLTGDKIIETVVEGERANYIQGLVNNELFFTSSHSNSPLDIFLINLVGKSESQLSSVNAEFLKDKQLPVIQSITFKAKDGTDVEGWFVKPPFGEPPYPTLLNIHGGPHAGWGNIFLFENQYLCGAGYAILMVNHRGSTGYGDVFSTAILGDWGNLDYHDLMAGVDKVINDGLVDEKRLGCFGISGGGNLSCWIIGQTNRFKAAVPENPVTNWQSMYGVSDIGRYFAQKELGGLPWEIPEIYKKVSPITYAHNCTTPTLLIQHDDDLRCPPEQSEQFFAVLRDVGCTVDMLRMPASPHGGSAIASLEIRETQNKAILDWFNRFVLEKEKENVK